MPARAAISTVAATVVAPRPRRASTGARSRSETFATAGSSASRVEQRVVRADDGLAVRDGDRGRRRAEAANFLLERAGGREVLRSRQAVRDDGGLERDDGSARRERRGDLGLDRELHLGAAARVTGLAAIAGEKLDRVGEDRQQHLERFAHGAGRTRKIHDERRTDGAGDAA